MVKHINREFRPEHSIDREFPKEMKILRQLLEHGPSTIPQERRATRIAFRDIGFLDIFNHQREILGEECVENVADVSWLDMVRIVQENLDQETAKNLQPRLDHEAWLAKIDAQDAEEAANREARRFESDAYKKLEPMSQGPEEARKWSKREKNAGVPFEDRSMNKTGYRNGAPIDASPEEYRELQEQRTKMIEERVAKEIADQPNITEQDLIRLRGAVTAGVDRDLGFQDIPRKKVEKPVSWKEKKKTRH